MVDVLAFLNERHAAASTRTYSAAGPSGRGESPLAKFLIGGAVTIVLECW